MPEIHHFIQKIQDSANKLIWVSQDNVTNILARMPTIMGDKLFNPSDFEIYHDAAAYAKYHSITKDELFCYKKIQYQNKATRTTETCPIPYVGSLIVLKGVNSFIAFYSFKTEDLFTYMPMIEKSTMTSIFHHFLIRYSTTQSDIKVMDDHLVNLRTELNAYTVRYMDHPMIAQPTSSFIKIPLLKYQRANIAWMENIEAYPPNFIFNKRRYYPLGVKDGVLQYLVNYEPFFVTETSTKYYDSQVALRGGVPFETDCIYDLPRITVKGGIVMDDPGLGKTVQMLYKAFTDTSSKPTLVIVPDHLVEHWTSEIHKFFVDTSRFITITDSNDFKNVSIYTNKVILTSVTNITKYCNFVFGGEIRNYESNFKAQEINPASSNCNSYIRKFFARPESRFMNFARIIIDEIHELYISVDGDEKKVRNPALLTLLQALKSDYRWACTATPFVVSEAIYYIMGYLCPGDNQLNERVICRYRNLYSIYKNIMRRNTKKSVLQEYKFPEVNRIIYQLELSPIERTVYDSEIQGQDNQNTLRKILSALVVNGSGSATSSEIFTNLDELKKAMIRKYTDIYEKEKNDFIDFIARIYDKYFENIFKEMNDETERIDSIDELYKKLKMKKDSKTLKQDKLLNFVQYEEFYQRFYKARKPYLFMNAKLKELERIEEFNKKTEEEQMEDEDDITKCVICMGPVSKSLVVMPCGHITCQECYHDVDSRGGLIIDRFHGGDSSYRKCPECSEKCMTQDIKFLSRMAKKRKLEEEYIQNYGTKLGNLILFLKKLKPTEKIVIYTQWNDIISKIYNSIISSELPISVYALTRDHTQAITDFKASTTSSVLILSSETKSAGINLIEADYVLLYEPIAGELGRRKELKTQIIGRCHRIGRTKPVKVIEFVVQNSIEDRLFKEEQSIAMDPNEFISTDYSLGQLYQDDERDDVSDSDSDSVSDSDTHPVVKQIDRPTPIVADEESDDETDDESDDDESDDDESDDDIDDKMVMRFITK